MSAAGYTPSAGLRVLLELTAREICGADPLVPGCPGIPEVPTELRELGHDDLPRVLRPVDARDEALHQAVEILAGRLSEDHVEALLPAVKVREQHEAGIVRSDTVIYLRTDPERGPAIALANAGILSVGERHGTALEFRATPLALALAAALTRPRHR